FFHSSKPSTGLPDKRHIALLRASLSICHLEFGRPEVDTGFYRNTLVGAVPSSFCTLACAAPNQRTPTVEDRQLTDQYLRTVRGMKRTEIVVPPVTIGTEYGGHENIAHNRESDVSGIRTAISRLRNDHID